jgi:hypothetical protein
LLDGCGEALSDEEPRYKPGVAVEVTGSAITIIWSGVEDPECWAASAIEILV